MNEAGVLYLAKERRLNLNELLNQELIVKKRLLISVILCSLGILPYTVQKSSYYSRPKDDRI